MKLGVSSYSFSQAVAAGTLQFNDIPRRRRRWASTWWSSAC